MEQHGHGGQGVVFSPFTLDVVESTLQRGSKRISLRRKTFAVLCCLVERPGQLVTKETLLDTVWPDVQVGPGGLAVCIHELRQALGDSAERPRFIETVGRLGYRFIAPLTAAPPVASSQYSVVSSFLPLPQDSGLSTQHSVLVGREAELAQLHRWLDKALNGARQLVFVTGEAGIGKTALVDAFLHHLPVNTSQG